MPYIRFPATNFTLLVHLAELPGSKATPRGQTPSVKFGGKTFCSTASPAWQSAAVQCLLSTTTYLKGFPQPPTLTQQGNTSPC